MRVVFSLPSRYLLYFYCICKQVFANDTLPHKICEVCNAKVDDFYQFWTSTAKNQKQLNDWLQVATDQKVDHASVAVPRVSGILTKVLNGSVTVPRVSEC